MKVSPMPRPPTAILSRSCAGAASATKMMVAASNAARIRKRMVPPPEVPICYGRFLLGRGLSRLRSGISSLARTRVRSAAPFGVNPSASLALERVSNRIEPLPLRGQLRRRLAFFLARHEAAADESPTLVIELEL